MQIRDQCRAHAAEQAKPLPCLSEWPHWADCQQWAVTYDQSPKTVFNIGPETEYQTIFTVYSSKGQQIMYKPVNKHNRANRHPTQAHTANRNRNIFLRTLSKQEMVGQCQVTIKGRDGHQAAMDPYRRMTGRNYRHLTDPTMQNRSHPLMRHFNTHLELHSTTRENEVTFYKHTWEQVSYATLLRTWYLTNYLLIQKP